MMSPDEFPDFFDLISWKWILLLLVVCIGRSWLKGQQYRGRETGKNLVALVTGPTGGIGKQIARELNLRGAKVHLLCRDKAKADAALSHLVSLGCNATRLVVHIADLADFASIRAAAAAVVAAEEKLDVLVCNAAVMLYPRFQLTKDGHELTWQTNYLGHFLLTELLLPLLQASASGRVVCVSAMALFYSDPLDLASVDQRGAWDQRQAYARSKLAQVMHVEELTRRLREAGSPVTANACHPGISRTSLARHTPLHTSALLKTLAAPFAWFFLKTPKDGAQTPICLALCKDLDGVSGKFYSEMGEASLDDAAYRKGLGADPGALYEYSLKAVGLKDE